MKYEKSFNPLSDFSLDMLTDIEFKEDSVREEIITPILKALGYSASKPNKIIRSRSLKHPFISIGSQRKEITCIPDYLLEVDGKLAWVLEAKKPGENILTGKHVEQAYSYAIHTEIRVPLFALCNGEEFVLYKISEDRPILHFKIEELPNYFEALGKYLSPQNALNTEYKLAKDFGLHLKRVGFEQFEHLVFQDVPFSYIAQLDGNKFTTATGIEPYEGEVYCVSFDFGIEVFEQMKGLIPDEAYEILSRRDMGQRNTVKFGDGRFLISVDCKVGQNLEENHNEIFLPLWVNCNPPCFSGTLN
ncbi:type I restriction enzyme HsdR N-terminal domain-containing protein [Vibrio pacinii]|uniref:type I restriction enzyme HsdR N-terminal domain-containing protein n=1 Tax=Vibrio pacinii TaxID=170674 RepID=UPI00068E941C|nr:type I restriction enzyme HsdR N-terminal domain-containing protein [Vibrio pacinii]